MENVKGIEYITGWRGTIEPIALVGSSDRGDYKAAIDLFNMDSEVAALIAQVPVPTHCPVCGSPVYPLAYIEGYGHLFRCPSIGCFPQIPTAFSKLLRLNMQRLADKGISVSEMEMYTVASYIHSRLCGDLFGIITMPESEMRRTGVAGKFPHAYEKFLLCSENLTIESPFEMISVLSLDHFSQEPWFPQAMYQPSLSPMQSAVDILSQCVDPGAQPLKELIYHPANYMFISNMERRRAQG